MNDDPEERVFSISVSSPCRAETERGISLNQSSLADVLSVYGSPTHAFLTTDTIDEWFFMYTSLCLIFQVKKDSSIPFDECPLSKQYKELHRNRRISAITVERPTATDIEEKESNVEAIFEEPVIPVSDYDSFEVTCAHCGWLSSSHYVLRMSLDKASRGEEISKAFGVEVSGLITQCTMPECRGYNRIMPNPSDPTSFTVVRYPSKEEEQHFKRRHSEVFPCGCPYCDPQNLSVFPDFMRPVRL